MYGHPEFPNGIKTFPKGRGKLKKWALANRERFPDLAYYGSSKLRCLEEWLRWCIDVADLLSLSEDSTLRGRFVHSVSFWGERFPFFREWMYKNMSLEEIRHTYFIDVAHKWQVITGCISDHPSSLEKELKKILNECSAGDRISAVIEDIEENYRIPEREKLAWILYTRGLIDVDRLLRIFKHIIIWNNHPADLTPYVLYLVERGEIEVSTAYEFLRRENLFRYIESPNPEFPVTDDTLRNILWRFPYLWRSEDDWKNLQWEPVIKRLGDVFLFGLSYHYGIPCYLIATYLGNLTGGKEGDSWKKMAIRELMFLLDKGEIPKHNYLTLWKEWGLPQKYVIILEREFLFSDEVTEGEELDISLSSLTWGVEIETIAPESVVEEGLVDIDSYHGGGGSIVYVPHWRAERDSSIKCYGSGFSCEVISPVLKGKRGIRILREAANALREHGHRVNKSCGFHIHVGWNPQWPSVYMARLIKIVYIWEDALWEITGAPYRKECGFAESVRKENDRKKALRKACEERNTMINLTNVANGGKSTVEFRLFPASLDADVLAAWVQVCLGLVEIALSTEAIPEVERGSAEGLLSYLGWIGGGVSRGLLEGDRKGILAMRLLEEAKTFRGAA